VEPTVFEQPETFYHRFDRYARAVSHQEAMQSQRLSRPLVDPEENLASGYSLLDPDGNAREQSSYGDRRFSSPYTDINSNDDSVLRATKDGSPAAPPISEKEMEEFREFQEAKRQRKKFDKYLIDPEEIVPNQIIGGPPVGTEQRRKIDEANVKALQEKLRRELAEEAAAEKAAQRDAARFNEDALPSSSDIEPRNRNPNNKGNRNDNRRSPSTLDWEADLAVPMDELLPPFPGKDPASPSSDSLPVPRSAYPEPDRREPGSERIPTPEPISPGFGERLDQLDAAKPESYSRAAVEFNAPMQTRVDSRPAARVAKIPEAWKFIQQPR
jgi:hypothetical protein